MKPTVSLTFSSIQGIVLLGGKVTLCEKELDEVSIKISTNTTRKVVYTESVYYTQIMGKGGFCM